MEFKKFSARSFVSEYPIIAIKSHRTLCQDILFDLTTNFVEKDTLKFSSAYFYDYRQVRAKTDWNTIYVIDGVSYLHQKSGTDKPLVKDRPLYYFLYVANDDVSAFAEALVTNPWLNDLCDRPTQFMSERVAIIRSIIRNVNSRDISGQIIDLLSPSFTPRGIWGLDYMFLWKTPNLPPELQLNESITLIPLSEYIDSFGEV